MLITLLALMRGSPIVLPLAVKRLFKRGSSSLSSAFGAVAGPMASTFNTPCDFFVPNNSSTLPSPGNTIRSNAARSKSHERTMTNSILMLGIQIRVDIPATWPTVEILGVKVIGDEGYLLVKRFEGIA